ncbi:unnamed protein product [Bursaphelenchus okinawaensis]|uniref:Calponin-homology (CH) domain-containing protein n=1 Tax=Bursaphelenchus okinawaensis TaxID=465554 RepID=A0A811LT31_9BILA|nr:unnamed protein product [Bursaphelenchus okinawaensis]CAG9128579.1 unnamed protein product [Bursaphelenchus okinawaensis]
MMNGDHALTASCDAFGLNSSYGLDFNRANTLNATIRRSDRGSQYRNLEQKRIERRSRSSRLTTTVRCGPFNGTDSGYITTGDDLRDQLESINLGLNELNASTKTLCYVDEVDVNSNDVTLKESDLVNEIQKTYEQSLASTLRATQISSVQSPSHSTSLLDLSNNNAQRLLKSRPTNVVPPLTRERANGVSSTTVNKVLPTVEENNEKVEITTKPPTTHLHNTVNGNVGRAKTFSTATSEAAVKEAKLSSAPSRPTESATRTAKTAGTANENGTTVPNGLEKTRPARPITRSGSISTATKLPSTRPSTLSSRTNSTTSSRMSSRSSSTMSLATKEPKVVRKAVAPGRGAKIQPVGSKFTARTIAPESKKELNGNPSPPKQFQKAQSIDRTTLSTQKLTTRPKTQLPQSKMSQSVMNLNGTAPTTSSSVEVLRKILQKHVTEKLEVTREKLAYQLADGVILCNFVNSLWPRTIPTVGKALGSLSVAQTRARKNVENFIVACRSHGVSDTSLCTVTDILERKNLQNTTKTVVALAKLVDKHV